MTKYYDTVAIIQVIGSIYNDPSLLDDQDRYIFNEEDFAEEFHKIIFGAIYNLHALGAKEIKINNIEDYLEQRPKKFAVYKAGKGAEYLTKISQNTQRAAFDYYYNRMKKMTLFRMYQSVGLNLSWLYDVNNILDIKKKQTQEEWLDKHSIEEIADIIDKRVSDIKAKYANNTDSDFHDGGEGIIELVESFEKSPQYGYPLYGRFVNAMHRGAILGKLYIRSATTGLGKTRMMAADVCSIGCNKIWDFEENNWKNCNNYEPILFITTEQDLQEAQTLMLAFVSGVDEEHIITHRYKEGELDRVMEAANIIKKSPIHTIQLPDFSMADIENTIRTGIRDFNTKYVFFDYLHSSMKILSEVGSKANVKGLREDNILFLISTKLKDLCNQYGVFILTSTQLNGNYNDVEVYDQNLLRGSKAIADKIDVGIVLLSVNAKDRDCLEPIVKKLGIDMPTIKMVFYKNRRARYKDVLLWCKSNLGTCRIDPLFVTDYSFQPIEINDVNIKIKTEMRASAF